MATGELWLSVGVHAASVLAEDFLFSVPDSGGVYTGHLVSSQFSRPAWLNGGAAGPEGSVLIFPLLVVGVALLWFAYPTPASRRLSVWSHCHLPTGWYSGSTCSLNEREFRVLLHAVE